VTSVIANPMKVTKLIAPTLATGAINAALSKAMIPCDANMDNVIIVNKAIIVDAVNISVAAAGILKE
jgi:hypothetical protein